MDTGHATTTVAGPLPLRRFLDERGIRYSWVAEKLGVSPSHMTQVMDGKRPLPRKHAETLAALFNEPIATFLPESTND